MATELGKAGVEGHENLARIRLEIHGAVQGVGFRPFVYRLAADLGLRGWVINDTQGVFIEVEGGRTELGRFMERLPAERPPRAIVQELQATWLAPAGYERFEIRHSDGGGSKTVLVLPDIATCPECLAETFDPGDRRNRYPFTNCTNCGPRFTIVEALPYDRPNTTMRGFTLCPACASEYGDPLVRRFHAQPNACPACGPRLELWGMRDGGSGMGTIHAPSAIPHLPSPWRLLARQDAALLGAAAALREGLIVAVKGLGGFHLMADARCSPAIRRLREGKPRREKPFAIMARDLAQAQALCDVPEDAAALMTGPEAPIVLLRRRPGAAAAVADEVAPGNPYLGIMLPYTPLHHLLLRELDFPVVATSGNLSDEPICTDEWEAFERLGPLADAFLIHNRPIARHADDSVVSVLAGDLRLVRRARGYAPLPVLLNKEAPTVLAVGAHLKNTVALSVGRQVFISQHIGDLETPQALEAFERVIRDFLRLYEANPVAIAHDLHPDYLSTKWAAEQGSRGEPVSPAPLLPCLVGVQHHHAHLAACLAENGWEGRALGVTWDGTGYGPDGTIWGGEFLLGDAAAYTRVAHLRPFRLPGGEAAIKEPARLALALLWELYGEEALAWEDLPSLAAFRPAERRVLAQMLRRGTNAPLTTAAGRLFDAIAALVNLRQRVTFEGQAAMALEYAADEGVRDAYPIGMAGEQGSRGDSGSPLLLDWAPLVEAALTDIRRDVPVGTIAARFHNALVEGIVQVAQRVGEETVACSGGCFQNRWLTERAAARLRGEGFRVLLHRQVPASDGGISLGQVAVAVAQLAAPRAAVEGEGNGK